MRTKGAIGDQHLAIMEGIVDLKQTLVEAV